jgi:hypothetical protein
MAYKAASLPPDLRLDATVPEVMAFRHESARSVFRKIANGTYRGHKNGDTRLIEWASVLEDRERCLARGPQVSPVPVTKRKPGRPRTEPETKAAAAE